MAMAFAWATVKRAGKAERFNPDLEPGKYCGVISANDILGLLCISDKLDQSRAECLNPEVVGEYFDLLDK